MPTLPFQGFEPMSVYITFSDYKSRGRRNLGILLTRDERSDPPAEHFWCQNNSRGVVGYHISQTPKRIKKVDVHYVCARSDLQLRTAVKMNKDPLSEHMFNRIRRVLVPSRYKQIGLSKLTTQEKWIKKFLITIWFDSVERFYFINYDIAQKVTELGNRNVYSKCSVFNIQQELSKEPPKPPRQSVWTEYWGK
ncbi:hypothetical protein DFH11DRAFT_1315950 [Phellopilus nigrolimitatus]|nr:hypothetical protein DFH11DRAFT_1315950 [Phellopilus nigrolimitatus]